MQSGTRSTGNGRSASTRGPGAGSRWLRVGTVALGLAICLLSSASVGAHAAAVPVSLATGSDGWTLVQAESAVQADRVARLPGAPAELDTVAVAAAITGTSIRVVLLPFAPLDDTGRDAAGTRMSDLSSWADGEDIDLVTVVGLQVGFSIYNLAPNSVPELAPVLAQMDVTHQVLTAVAKISKGPDLPDPTARPEIRADPGDVATITAALTADGIYNGPDLADPQQIDSTWSASYGAPVRVAFLPAAPAGSPLTDLLTPLHQRFSGDVVIVVRGRWLEIAGPDDEVLQSARLWMYGSYQRPALGWDVSPSALVGVLADQVHLLRSGVVSDQSAPKAPTDPVSSAGRWLPWLFVATAGALAVTGGLLARRRRAATERERNRASTMARRVLGARLAAVAGQIVDLDGLARGGRAGSEVSSAAERYDTGRQILSDDGAISVAGQALTAAEHHLQSAAELLDVPLSGGRRAQ